MSLIRLQKIIARAGLSSLRQAEKMIAAGRVAVDGQVVTVLGTKVDPEINTVSVDGKNIQPSKQKYYFLLNKPTGFLTTKSDPKDRPTVMKFILEIGRPLNPVGRLDFDTEGLLILTNDGDLIFQLTHPKFEIEKEYLVETSGELTADMVSRLRRGIMLEDGRAAPAKVTDISVGASGSRFHLTIYEGKKREIRRMGEALGLPVIKLKRLRMGPMILGDLPTGQWRELSENEIIGLKSYVKRKVAHVR